MLTGGKRIGSGVYGCVYMPPLECKPGTITTIPKNEKRAGVKQVVVSLGGDGVAWCDADGQTGHRPAHKVAVVNTSGAGDALLAGLVLCCSEGLPLPQAVQGAMACAEITLASPHANSPHLSVAALRAHLGDAGWPGGDRQPKQP